LSFSQRSCVVFAKLTLVCPHLLIMDEPTNFLDLESVDSLIQACNKYRGALLLVSHNRDFLKKCARQYLSIVPGQFNLYDTLKVAEKATYTFIDELEQGGKIGKDAIVNNPGGGSIHSSQKVPASDSTPTIESSSSSSSVAQKIEATSDKIHTLATASPIHDSTTSSSTNTCTSSNTVTPTSSNTSTTSHVPTTSKVEKEKEEIITFNNGEQVSALWTDGKWYKAVVRSSNQNGKYTVFYTDYGNVTTLPPASIRKWVEQADKTNQHHNQRQGTAKHHNRR